MTNAKSRAVTHRMAPAWPTVKKPKDKKNTPDTYAIQARFTGGKTISAFQRHDRLKLEQELILFMMTGR